MEYLVKDMGTVRGDDYLNTDWTEGKVYCICGYTYV